MKDVDLISTYNLAKNLAKKILLACLSPGVILIQPCFAQSNIAPDSTLGNEASTITPNVNNLDGIPSTLIEGGAQRGQNLFHSLQELNVSEGRGAYFLVPNDNIQNVLTRVTGNNPSSINGILGTISNRNFDPTNANLFLINPNGIVFGRDGSLDINGSFVGTTANGIEFGDQEFFSTTNPQVPSGLLTVSPSAFLFSQINAQASIQSASVAPGGLRVGDSKSLLLLGGNLNLDGGGLEGGLSAVGGRVELGGLASTGTVGLNVDGNNLSFSFPDGIDRSDVTLNNSARVNVGGANGGTIAINSRNLDITQGSQLLGGIASGLGSPDTQAGNIEINATGTVVVDGVTNGFRSGLFNQVEAGSAGNSGNIDISAGSVEVKNGGQFNVSALGRGNSGTIRINATDKVTFDGAPDGFQSSAFSQVGENAVGNSGGIEINANNVEVTDGGYLEANTLGTGDAGKIEINAREKVVVDGQSSFNPISAVFSQVEPNAVGNSGGVEINAANVEITNGGQLNAITFSKGDAGIIRINATDNVVFNGVSPFGVLSSAISQVQENAEGDSQGIEINGSNVEISGGALLTATTLGKGNSGKIRISGTERVVFTGEYTPFSTVSFAISQVFAGAEGNSEGIEINGGSVEILNGAQLTATTLGTGNSGLIKINGTERVVFDGESTFGSRSTAISQVFRGAEGNSGGIEINGGRVEMINGSFVDASTFGKGDAGAVQITSPERVVFDGESSGGFVSAAFSQVTTEAEGNSGGIIINAGIFEVTKGAQISTTTFGKGNSGNIQVTATDKVILDGKSQNGSRSSTVNSEVRSEAVGNSLGIIIDTPTLKLSDTAFISTTTLGNGQAGDITVNSINLDLTDGSRIFAESTGIGIAGDININLKDNFYADNGQAIAKAEQSRGGNIAIAAGKNIILRNNSDIRTTLQSTQERGGNIKLNANAIVALEDSDILAFAPEGSGGNIEFNTRAFLSDPLYRPTSQTADPLREEELNQLDGNNRVDVNASGSINSGIISGIPDISFLQNSLIELPENLIDSETLVANSCVVRSKERNGTFFITGSGGLPLRPDDPLPSSYPAVNVQSVPNDTSAKKPRRPWKIGDPIVEPKGVYRLDNGQSILSRECGN